MPMVYEAKNPLPWDLSTPKTMRSNFTSKSFYIVIDGARSETVRLAAELIKKAIQESQGGIVRGPLAQPTMRRRYMVLRDLQDDRGNSIYLSRAKRYRNVLLVQQPTSIGVSAMISLPIPKSVNVQIQPYESQFELKERL
ncbi:30S ribosomal protein S10 [Stutzerimonas stutzeri]|uniref:30S ribosomal protein S10 n=1 Tax=Stutzerimonas stutzeri TaxID=316 RepID=UPI001BCFC8CE|nr:30S ribosomal protein S10 [Stutzerimonas stutzeri]